MKGNTKIAIGGFVFVFLVLLAALAFIVLTPSKKPTTTCPEHLLTGPGTLVFMDAGCRCYHSWDGTDKRVTDWSPKDCPNPTSFSPTPPGQSIGGYTRVLTTNYPGNDLEIVSTGLDSCKTICETKHIYNCVGFSWNGSTNVCSIKYAWGEEGPINPTWGGDSQKNRHFTTYKRQNIPEEAAYTGIAEYEKIGSGWCGAENKLFGSGDPIFGSLTKAKEECNANSTCTHISELAGPGEMYQIFSGCNSDGAEPWDLYQKVLR